jgi:hypothetical protein
VLLDGATQSTVDTSELLSVDLSTGADGPPIPLTYPDFYPWTKIDIDSTTGDATESVP